MICVYDIELGGRKHQIHVVITMNIPCICICISVLRNYVTIDHYISAQEKNIIKSSNRKDRKYNRSRICHIDKSEKNSKDWVIIIIIMVILGIVIMINVFV